jgi:hypothetical protein
MNIEPVQLRQIIESTWDNCLKRLRESQYEQKPYITIKNKLLKPKKFGGKTAKKKILRYELDKLIYLDKITK